ncbi:E3 ubiquitin-protein ligase RNF138-like [Peromyscus eremicus]|uniref:E3 ubiquitin-protein ligase RNF138-like n=1 Tax=Peromyscus eremicus TaxID=42410 RepID=UPI0027DE4A93|nr:E3 ubiquitin-protein ligase RNF138-like [Peromyscus eremicus]
MESSSGPPPPPQQPRADSRHRLGPPLVTTMAEDESASTPYTEDDFYCPICQEVFKTPVRVAACQHVFCRKCFLTAMKESRIHCPLCRGNVTRRERACPERALDLETIMRSFPGNCRCCSQRIELYRMRQHYKTCEKYQDEFGVSSAVPTFQLSPDSVGNSNSNSNSEASTSGNEARHPPQAYQEEGNASPPDQPTFDCPLCEEVNMTRQHLLDHCNSNHRAHVVPVICPICLSLPWGDPTQLTRNFVSHLNQRHQFDYEDFVNLQLDEETQYQIAIEESFHINI